MRYPRTLSFTVFYILCNPVCFILISTTRYHKNRIPKILFTISRPLTQIISTMLNLSFACSEESQYQIKRGNYRGLILIRPVITGSFICHKEITDYVTETSTTAGEIRYNPPPQSRAQQEQGTSP